MSEQLLHQSVSQFNILPLTSRCGVGCVFCSHRYNPPGVRAVFFGELPVDKVRELMVFLDGNKKIYIGESATLLCEGEPLLHPQFGEILVELRRNLPRTPIQLTTNAVKLAAYLDALAAARPLELMVSLNSANPRMRRELMGPHGAEAALGAVARLQELDLPWHASLVLMPHITGWQDVENSIAFACEHGAISLRLLLPGFSKLASVDWTGIEAIPAAVRERLPAWRQKFSLPLTMEPPLLNDLIPRVAGVLANSPAAGVLRPDDVVETINGHKPWSRVDAFNKLFGPEKPVLRVRRQQRTIELTLDKQARSPSGVVMDRDLDPADMERARAMAAGVGRVLLLTSTWAAPLWEQVVPARWQVKPVPSRFFGGTIAAAGLLTASDYLEALGECDLTGVERILLPPVSFDQSGRDLRGEQMPHSDPPVMIAE